MTVYVIFLLLGLLRTNGFTSIVSRQRSSLVNVVNGLNGNGGQNIQPLKSKDVSQVEDDGYSKARASYIPRAWNARFNKKEPGTLILVRHGALRLCPFCTNDLFKMHVLL
jgi:hypothetical protein